MELTACFLLPSPLEFAHRTMETANPKTLNKIQPPNSEAQTLVKKGTWENPEIDLPQGTHLKSLLPRLRLQLGGEVRGLGRLGA